MCYNILFQISSTLGLSRQLTKLREHHNPQDQSLWSMRIYWITTHTRKIPSQYTAPKSACRILLPSPFLHLSRKLFISKVIFSAHLQFSPSYGCLGIPLYMASSAFVRHTLNALYSDISVVLRKVIVNTPRSRHPLSTHTGSSQPSEPEHDKHTSRSLKRKSREKSLFIGLCVTGTGRVSGGRGEWEVYVLTFFLFFHPC